MDDYRGNVRGPIRMTAGGAILLDMRADCYCVVIVQADLYPAPRATFPHEMGKGSSRDHAVFPRCPRAAGGSGSRGHPLHQRPVSFLTGRS